MADIAWPLTLPNCAETWQETETPSSVIRTDMDTGPPKIRRRFTAPIRDIHVSMTLSVAQYMAFRTFYDVDCAQGINWHLFPHPYSGVMERFRFVEPPMLQSQGALAVQVQMHWEQLPYA